MTMRSSFILGTAAACTVALACCLVRASISKDAPAPRLLPTPPAVASSFVGTGSCAGRSCHGSLEPSTQGRLAQDEYSCWLMRDGHQTAFDVLKEKRGRDIARRLNIPDGKGYESGLCLSCHTTPAAAVEGTNAGIAALAREERQFGVGCESCHGNAPGWIDAHVTWPRNKPATEKTHAGMTDVADLATIARKCAGCHVGAPPDADSVLVRDVNHDLIAAGHPRLAFEFSSFFANMPPHWKTKTGPEREGRRWAVGQSTAAEAALKLLSHRAQVGKRPENGAWPEFSEYGCFSCHHALTEPSWRQQAETHRKRGSLAWGSWYFPLCGALAERTLPAPADRLPQLARLGALMARSFPSAKVVDRQAQAALAEMLQLTTRLERWDERGDREWVDRLLANPRLESEGSWETAEQTYLAVAALNVSLKDITLAKRLDALLSVRAFPSEFNSPSSTGDSFRPDRVFKGLRGR